MLIQAINLLIDAENGKPPEKGAAQRLLAKVQMPEDPDDDLDDLLDHPAEAADPS